MIPKHNAKTSRFLLVLAIALPIAFFAYQAISKNNRQLPTATTTVDAGNLFSIENWQTEQGVDVYYVGLHELPILDVRLLFKAGSAFDGEKAGVAKLTSSLIGENTRSQDATQIAESFENIGALFSPSVNRDQAAIHLRTLSDAINTDTAVNQLNTILNESVFTDDSFSREKQNQLTALQAQKQSPQAIISNAFYEKLYLDHPYATPVTGTENTVSTLTVDDVNAFFNKHYVKENAILVITGDITREDAVALSENIISNLPSGQSANPVAAISNNTHAIAHHIEYPSSQTHIRLGLPTLEKGNPDFFPMYVGNHVLGGSGLISKLFEIIRDKNGLAYSVGSGISTMKQPGPFFIALQTKNETGQQALSLTQKTLAEFIETGPTQAELIAAKQNITGGFALGLGSHADVNAFVSTIAFYELPLDYHKTFIDNIDAVTTDDVRSAFTHYVDMDKIVTLTVGTTM